MLDDFDGLLRWAIPRKTRYAALGRFLPRAELVKLYGESSGRNMAQMPWFLVLACILEGTYARAEEFMDRYGLPVLQNCGATEFSGAVAGWKLPDFKLFWDKKIGSVGRFQPGVTARVVDQETREALTASDDHREAMTVFVEKRPPVYHGR